jgi:hypothetical protein
LLQKKRWQGFKCAKSKTLPASSAPILQALFCIEKTFSTGEGP